MRSKTKPKQTTLDFLLLILNQIKHLLVFASQNKPNQTTFHKYVGYLRMRMNYRLVKSASVQILCLKTKMPGDIPWMFAAQNMVLTGQSGQLSPHNHILTITQHFFLCLALIG